MKLKGIILGLLLTCVSLGSGCADFGEGNVELDTSETVIEQNTETIVMGQLSHGLDDNYNDNLEIHYTGGEMDLEYIALGRGMSDGVGFMIFIDGVAQPYKLSGENEKYKYMHVINLEDDIEKEMVFSFIPIQGEKGKVSEVCVTSIYNPLFVPDMKENKGYGMYHDMLEVIFPLVYDEDPLEKYDYNVDKSIVNTVASDLIQNNLSNEEKATLISQYGMSEEDYEKDVVQEVYLNNSDMHLGGYYDVSMENVLELIVKLSGNDDIEYVTTVFLDHQPINNQPIAGYETLIESGKKHEIFMQIDVSEMEGMHSLYVVSVPKNSLEYSDENMGLIKSKSITLLGAEVTDQDDSQMSLVQKLKEDCNRYTIEFEMNMCMGMQMISETEYLIYDENTVYVVSYNDNEFTTETINICEGITIDFIRKCKDGYLVVCWDGNDDVVNFYSEEGIKLWGGITVSDIVESHGDDLLRKWFWKYDVVTDKSGRYLLYDGKDGLSLFDTNQMTAKTVVRIDPFDSKYEMSKGIISFSDFDFLDESKRIVFSSYSIDLPKKENSDSYRTCGVVNVDGSELKVWARSGWNPGNLVVCGDKTIFSEGENVGVEPLNQLLIYDFGENQLSELKMLEIDESISIYESFDKSMFATVAESTNEKISFNIYDVESNEAVDTKVIHKDSGSVKYMEEVMYLNETQKMVILYNHGNTGKYSLVIE